ncbi:MAG: deoxyribose-phosphate aldolase [Christensenellales bacterium]|jgi:deoxyribose-phosphate aldolase
MVDLSKLTKWELGKVFDFSVLPKNSTEEDIRKGCRLAKQYNCASFYAATNYWLPVMKEELADSDVHLGVGLAFPFGGNTAYMKGLETEEAVKMGATALDIVMNIGALRSKRYDDVAEELRVFKEAAQGNITKCILEVNFLTDEEIATGCKLIAEAGLDYAKTSSGQFEGPSMDQFLVMKETLKGTSVKLKVAGVKFPRPQNAYAFIMAGADLIGTRAAPEIIDHFEQMREIGIVPKYNG